MREMAILRWLKNLFDSGSHDADLNDEVCFHLRMRAESHMLTGKSEEDAMELARKQFGDIETIKRAMRGARLHPIYALLRGGGDGCCRSVALRFVAVVRATEFASRNGVCGRASSSSLAHQDLQTLSAPHVACERRRVDRDSWASPTPLHA